MVRKCQRCQEFANIPRRPPKELTPIALTWPFAQWGVGIVKPLPPGKGVKFVVVFVDYFTKWVQVEAMTTAISNNIKKCRRARSSGGNSLEEHSSKLTC
jgi:hypothetical protein